MKPRSTISPLAQLVLDVIQRSERPVHKFLQKIGISNVAKAIRQLDVALVIGQVNPHLLQLIQASDYKIPEVLLQQVIRQNNLFIEQLRQEELQLEEQIEAARFKPRIEVVPELVRPTSISMYAVTGGNLRFTSYLPDEITSLPLEQQYSLVKKSILENYSKHQGRTFFTGLITGYYYYAKYGEQPDQFDVQGNVVGVVNKAVRKTSCSAVIGNKLSNKFVFV